MQTPLLVFQVYPAAAPCANFGVAPVSPLEAAFSTALIGTLEAQGVPATPSPLQEGSTLEREEALDHFARLAATQAADRERYALAINQAVNHIPSAKIFKSRDVLMDEVQGRHPERINAENWKTHLLPDEGARYFLHFPMFRDLREVMLGVTEAALNYLGGNGFWSNEAESPIPLLLYDEPETGVPRFRAKGPEDPEGGRGAAMVLFLEADQWIPRDVRVGWGFHPSATDSNNTAFLQELRTLTDQMKWMLDNYRARIKRQEFLQIGESIWVAGREIRLAHGGKEK